MLPLLWTDSKLIVKSRITREIHAVKKTREFHDNKSENISSESIRGEALIQGQCLLTFLSQMQHLYKGGTYSSKYGIGSVLACSFTCSRLLYGLQCHDCIL